MDTNGNSVASPTESDTMVSGDTSPRNQSTDNQSDSHMSTGNQSDTQMSSMEEDKGDKSSKNTSNSWLTQGYKLDKSYLSLKKLGKNKAEEQRLVLLGGWKEDIYIYNYIAFKMEYINFIVLLRTERQSLNE